MRLWRRKRANRYKDEQYKPPLLDYSGGRRAPPARGVRWELSEKQYNCLSARRSSPTTQLSSVNDASTRRKSTSEPQETPSITATLRDGSVGPFTYAYDRKRIWGLHFLARQQFCSAIISISAWMSAAVQHVVRVVFSNGKPRRSAASGGPWTCNQQQGLQTSQIAVGDAR